VETREADPQLLLSLARRLRERVRPELGSLAGRRAVGDGAGGDVTFAVDEIAEAELEAFIEELGPAHPGHLAYYSEDRGLVLPDGDASHVLIVDPIDGTRPAMAGLESACVAVAIAPLGEGEPAMRDLEAGCVLEIKTGDWFLAARGRGLQSSLPARVSANSDIGRMFWGYGFRGRPAAATVEVLRELIDASSVGGGTFELGSQAFVMTRVVTGQLDAVVEVGSRMIDEVPGLRAEFERIGGGQVLNNSPYDLAAAWLCVVEAGGVVSDGWGEPLDHRRLLGSGHEFQMSSITAGCRELHVQLVRAVDAGIARLRASAG
jgi:myo-inositol-1(or 4)-monophosphatase